jgi:large subunit ribosomal protein L23
MKPKTTEKSVRLIESENTLVFEYPKKHDKGMVKKEIEELFKVKIDRINSHIKDNKKYFYIKLNKDNPAIDIATRLGII